MLAAVRLTAHVPDVVIVPPVKPVPQVTLVTPAVPDCHVQSSRRNLPVATPGGQTAPLSVAVKVLISEVS